ncbi:hypothetical protein ACSBOX_04485 [Arthrobacter sp. KN11-1C]|uniref:hypothetical protein n=1 Tax=Arthrobacter sp. KN11-1C TaxID=3445774 RepID=UPI003F9F24F2
MVLGLDKVTFATVSGALTAFAALSFGGCVTSATVAIALPSDRLLATMSLNSLGKANPDIRVIKSDSGLVAVDREGQKPDKALFDSTFRSHYVELIFTFVYSAYVQLMLAVISVVVLLLQGPQALAQQGCNFGSRVSLFILVAAFIYSVLQLIASLEALVSIGKIRDKYSRSDLLEP